MHNEIEAQFFGNQQRRDAPETKGGGGETNKTGNFDEADSVLHWRAFVCASAR